MIKCQESKPWVYVHNDGSETRVSDAAGYEEFGWVYKPLGDKS